jgi:threonine dehydrogenase-like Zn-dependent dehydrogenase
MESAKLLNTDASRAPRTAPSHMRALRIIAPRRAEVDKIAVPDPGPTQVRIRLEGCGICGSNLAVWQGRPWFDYPFPPGAPGHEGWGIIDAIGEAVQNVKPGQRVAFLSGHALAEYDVADVESVVLLPSTPAAFPGEALGCAVNIMRRSAIEKDHTIAVIGVGFIGALLVQMASRLGARVIAISRRPFALKIARLCGAVETVQLDSIETVAARLCDITGKATCERVIEAVGEQQSLDLASALTGERGRLIIAGYHQDADRRINMQLWNWRGIDIVNAHERDPRIYIDGMREAARSVDEGRLAPSFLITHSFALDQITQAFSALQERPDGFLKAWVRTGGV